MNKAVKRNLIVASPAKNVALPKQKSTSDSVKCFTPKHTIIFISVLNEVYSSEYTFYVWVIKNVAFYNVFV